MKRLTLIASAAALGLGGAAAADHHMPGENGQAMSGQHHDMSQHDQMMSGHEGRSKDDMAFEMMFDSRLEQAFNAIDGDDSDGLSRQEWGEWQADDGFYAERFDEFDRDGNGTVSWQEYRGAARAMYDVSGM